MISVKGTARVLTLARTDVNPIVMPGTSQDKPGHDIGRVHG